MGKRNPIDYGHESKSRLIKSTENFKEKKYENKIVSNLKLWKCCLIGICLMALQQRIVLNL